MGRKVMINRCYGGFSLSRKAFDLLCERGHPLALAEQAERATWDARTSSMLANSYLGSIARHDSAAVAVVEELGEAASGECAKVRVVELSGPLYRIDEYDGMENIEQPDGLDWTNADAPVRYES